MIWLVGVGVGVVGDTDWHELTSAGPTPIPLPPGCAFTLTASAIATADDGTERVHLELVTADGFAQTFTHEQAATGPLVTPSAVQIPRTGLDAVDANDADAVVTVVFGVCPPGDDDGTRRRLAA
jgi:hypothetical protein